MVYFGREGENGRLEGVGRREGQVEVEGATLVERRDMVSFGEVLAQEGFQDLMVNMKENGRLCMEPEGDSRQRESSRDPGE